MSEEDEKKIEQAGLMEDDEGDSREERAFRLWLNSLNIDDGQGGTIYCHSLTDGIAEVRAVVLDEVNRSHDRRLYDRRITCSRLWTVCSLGA